MSHKAGKGAIGPVLNFLIAVVGLVLFFSLTYHPVWAGTGPTQKAAEDIGVRVQKIFKSFTLTVTLKDGRSIKAPVVEPFNTYTGKTCSTLADGNILPNTHDLKIIDGLFADIPCFLASLSHSGNDPLILSVCNAGMKEVEKNFKNAEISPQQLCYAFINLARNTDYLQCRKFVVFLNMALKNKDEGFVLSNINFLFPSEKFVSQLVEDSNGKVIPEIQSMAFLVVRILQNAHDPRFYFKEKKSLIEDLVFNRKFDLNKYTFPDGFLSVYYNYEEIYLKLLSQQIDNMRLLRKLDKRR